MGLSEKSEPFNWHAQIGKDILVAKLVHGDGCVLGVGVADVCVAIVLWNEVHIMEEETVPVFLPHGLPKTHIHQLGPVKSVVSGLQSKQTLSIEAGWVFQWSHFTHLSISLFKWQVIYLLWSKMDDKVRTFNLSVWGRKGGYPLLYNQQTFLSF